MLTKETILKYGAKVKFKSSYKHTMVYEGVCGELPFELHVYDYRWEFEPEEDACELIEIADNCEVKPL